MVKIIEDDNAYEFQRLLQEALEEFPDAKIQYRPVTKPRSPQSIHFGRITHLALIHNA